MSDRGLRVAVLGAFALVAVAGCFSERVAAPERNPDLCTNNDPAVIRVRNFSFQPAQLTVQPGTEVTWVNCGPDQHTSTSDAGVWSSGLLAPNAVFRRTFNQAGSFPYHCDPHPFMMGTIVVQ
ncbi:MAG TPA: plastocyanin/azurin family copper-binding protein [Longimicrobiaceae bacterium]|nr:plastocyanin/azurin family copper-binding protein [Longimicrobiaceae bacterium]